MADNEHQSYTIQIAGEGYPVKLTTAEMASVQKIEKELNEKINEYRVRYAVDNTRDILSMLLISYAFELHNSVSADELDEANRKLERMLEKASRRTPS